MQISLHNATEDVRALLDQMDDDGVMPEGFEQARDVVAKKAVAVTAYVLETERGAGMLLDYAKEVTQRARTMQRRAEYLRKHLSEHMAASGVLSIKDERGIFSAKLERERDAAVEVFDEAQLPADYLRVIPEKHEPDKALIKKAIGDGFDVPGARIVKRDRLTVK